MKIQHTQRYPNRKELVMAHLELINCILPVKTTPKERELLASFMSKPGEKFSPKNKKQVKEELGIHNNQMSTLIRLLIDKGFLREKEEDGLLEIHPNVLLNGDGQQYEFTYILDEEEVYYNPEEEEL